MENQQMTASELALFYYQVKNDFDEAKKEFESIKNDFEGSMEIYFDKEQVNKMEFNYDNLEDELNLSVSRIEKNKVKFNLDKLEEKLNESNLSKEDIEKVILKRYEITNLKGLIEYLKSCGVSPKVFKSFIEVNKTIDENALDKLEEQGKLNVKNIEGSYTIEKSKPCFMVKKVKSKKWRKKEIKVRN